MKKMMIICLYVFLSIALIYAGLFFFQDRFLFRPNTAYVSPREAGFPQLKEVEISSGQFGWLFEKKHPVILYLHGNTGQNADFVAFLEPYMKKGWTVLMVEYPGYGKNADKPSEEQMIENGIRAYDFLKSKGYEDIVIHGFSIGTGVALGVAEKRTPKALVLEGAFYSILQMAKHKYPLPGFSFLLKNPFLSNERIGKISVPLLMLHGTEDRTVPYKQGVALYDRALSKDKTFVRMEGVGHTVARYGSFDEIVPWIEKRK